MDAEQPRPEQYVWQHFSPEQIIARDGNRITITQAPFYKPEQWTAVQDEEDGSVLAYRGLYIIMSEDNINQLRDPYPLLPQKAASLHSRLEDGQAVFAAMTAAFRQLAEVFVSLFQSMAPTFEVIGLAIGQAMNAGIDACMHAYIKDGAPYGPTAEGLWRWIREKRKQQNEKSLDDVLRMRDTALKRDALPPHRRRMDESL